MNPLPQFDFTPAPPMVKPSAGHPLESLRTMATREAANGRVVMLACLSTGSRERLFQMASEEGMQPIRIAHWNEMRGVKPGQIGMAACPLQTGFASETTLVLSEADVLGEKVIRAKKKQKTVDVFMAEAAHLEPGELVVHKEHGIGRFEKLETVTVGLMQHDCLKLIYAGDDRLFLPVVNMDMLSRFGSDSDGVQLDKLGAASWQARKARMKERISIAAEELMKTAAQRATKPGVILEAEGEDYAQFVDQFGFVETDDQARSIDEVAADLTSGKPMDRLICGDVGFGKTEVALRAAFIATHATPPKQVALIVPTTLLARQHVQNFRTRFAHFDVTIGQLSRLAGSKEQKQVKEGLKDGSVDIVIGTHALLAKSIEFKRLGLVIVDEEQHFGVGQKERLKELKNDVHVLTLSATPIPRTLQLALSGVRDLSLITTPPVDRLAIRSFVTPFDPVMLREALLREKHRGGGSFIVTPRIKDMGELKAKITALVPELKILTAHGQMTPADLDSIMDDFYERKADVLLSTAIIESGLDIPHANTIIVHKANLFGLAQLYQMRGRVGRGKQRAYAYFLLPKGKLLTKEATKRLEVMQSLDQLGAGFTLASHDMDIRGFGNLVGEAQSGHVREVGVELYQQMLHEAIESSKSGEVQVDTDFSPEVNLGFSALIPESYVDDVSLRMGLYKRIGSLQTREEINHLAAEMIDRFGALPIEVDALLKTIEVKQQCKAAAVKSLDVGPKGAVLTFHAPAMSSLEYLLTVIDKYPTRLKLRPDQSMVLAAKWMDDEAMLEDVRNMLSELVQS